MIRHGFLSSCLGSWSLSWLAAVAVAGNAGGATVEAVSPAATENLVAPYQDVSLSLDESALAHAAGLKFLTFAFIEAASSTNCTAAWGGLGPVSSDGTLTGYVSNIRTAGGDVIFSFGGASGFELADVCTSVSKLQAQYQKVIDKYGAKRLDFDIEVDDADSIDNKAAIDLRNRALAALQKANPGLLISYTLPVDVSGLESNALFVLQSAKKFGVTVHSVNIMTMDYGSPANPRTEGKNAVSSANNTLAQLAQLGLNAGLGIIVLPGKEDTFTSSYPEEFTLTDAQTVVTYANAHRSQIDLLSFWELSRDQECPGGGGGPDENTCSSITQQPNQFSHIFEQF
jgi:chitinase